MTSEIKRVRLVKSSFFWLTKECTGTYYATFLVDQKMYRYVLFKQITSSEKVKWKPRDSNPRNTFHKRWSTILDLRVTITTVLVGYKHTVGSWGSCPESEQILIVGRPFSPIICLQFNFNARLEMARCIYQVCVFSCDIFRSGPRTIGGPLRSRKSCIM